MIIKLEYIPFLVAVLVFITILLFFMGIFIHSSRRARQRKVIDKIKHGGMIAEPVSRTQKPADSTDSILKRFLNFFGLLGERVKIESYGEGSHSRLSFFRAGFRGENAPAIFWGIKIFLALLLPTCFLLTHFFKFKSINSSETMLICVFFALAGFYLPNFWLIRRIAIRRDKIIKGLPDALDLMVVCVEAGMGLDAAFNRVAEEIKLSHPEMSEEFKLLTLELRAGKLRRDALKSLSLRINQIDVNSLVTVLIQTDKFGTSVAQALRVYSDSLRTKRYQKAQEQAAKLPVKLIFPLVLFIFPALFVVIAGPAVILIYRAFIKGF